MSKRKKIIVVGAGPVGAVAALACVQRGFSVTLIDAAAEVDTSPRAATTHPSTLEMIASLGIVDEFIKVGLVARYFDFWDQTQRELVARFDHNTLRDDTDFPFVVQTEQHKLVNIVLPILRGCPDVDVRFSTALTGIEQSADSVRATLQTAEGSEVITADYMIGADGGRSTVRKMLDIEFEGYTWPERFLVLTTSFDFAAAIGCSYRSYISDPDQWGNLFKIAGDDQRGRWRAVFPVHADLSDESALAEDEAQTRLNRLLPREEPYTLLHRNLYRVHQRVAASFRKHRVFLAGDSGHVNNPIGGLGLNCGIHDALELADTLSEVGDFATSATSLDRYERRRRTLNIEFVQQQTVANKKRLEEKDPVARAQNLRELAQSAADPVRHRAFLMRSSLLQSVRSSKDIA